jgi:hypothetical protein
LLHGIKGKNNKISLRSLAIPLKEKLQMIFHDFEMSLNKNQSFKPEEKNLMKIILKFLFDFDVTDKEFWNLPEHFQKNFKKFIADRFFKHEAGKSEDYKSVYHDLSVRSDNLSTFSAISMNVSRNQSPMKYGRISSDGNNNFSSINSSNFIKKIGEVPLFKRVAPVQNNPKQLRSESNREIIQLKSFTKLNGFKKLPSSKKISKRALKRRSKGSIKIRVRETKPGIIEYVDPTFFTDSLIPGRVPNKIEGQISFKISRFSMEDLLDSDMQISLLQDYLRKRERLNLICRRKKKMHSKTKRNDEKTKKIFKKAVKILFNRFKKVEGNVK